MFNESSDSMDMRYMDRLYQRLDAAARKMMEGEWGEYVIGFHSAQCDENRNRRYTTEDNHATFNAHRPILHKLSTGVTDPEVGTLILMGGNGPAYVVGNWAAHALTAHAPGLGGLRISSDFPGFYRRYIESETGAKAMFVQGAAGDLARAGTLTPNTSSWAPPPSPGASPDSGRLIHLFGAKDQVSVP